MRKETRCRHIGYSYRLTARVLLYAGKRNSSMGPPHEGSIRRPERSTSELRPAPNPIDIFNGLNFGFVR